MNRPAGKPGRNTSRLVAVKTLQKILAHNGSLAALSAELKPLPANQQAETREFCYGLMRWYFELDGLLQQLLEKPLRQKDSDIRTLLLLGLYQLRHMRIAEHAAVSETVAVAGALNKHWAKKLVNAVLRNYQRRADTLEAGLSEFQKLALPDWLGERLQQAWPQQFEQLAAASNQRPVMTLRVNLQQTTRDDYRRLLTASGHSSTEGRLSPAALTLENACDVYTLPGFADGMLSVQDEAAQLAADLLQIEDGHRVLDACCAPGGKTGHLLEQGKSIELDAIDNKASRLKRVEENLQRLGATARLIEGDARQPAGWARSPYQRILLDVPCSASGVLRRNPDVKYLRQARDIAALNQQQHDILAACWPLLDDGGLLLYVTCSILPEENERIIASFVESQNDAEHDPISAPWGMERAFGRQLLPASHDGFYYARLKKVAQRKG